MSQFAALPFPHAWQFRCFCRALLLCLVMAGISGSARGDDASEPAPIEIADVQHEGPVDFESEILPILKRNCIACHNQATKKGELVLETPQTIAAGGASGDAVEPGSGDDSYLLMVASHQSEPIMPPVDNKVGAKALTPEELGLLRLWIDQGATGEVQDRAASIQWQPLPAGVNPIYAVSVTPDGQFAACGRANQIYVYHLPLGRLLCRLTDPHLLEGALYSKPGVAHLDLVHSLAFSPDGYTLASGDYRVVKLWQRPRNVERLQLADSGAEIQALAVSADRQRIATAGADRRIRLWDAQGKAGAVLEGHTDRITGLQFSADGAQLFSVGLDATLRSWNVADGAQLATIDTPAALNGVARIDDGSLLATAGADGVVTLWRDPSPVKQLASLPGAMTVMAVSADLTRLAALAAEGRLQVRDLTSGQVVREIASHGTAPSALAISHDGKWLATAASDGLVRVYDLGSEQGPLVGSGPAGATVVAWHPQSELLATSGSDGKITVWSLHGATPGEIPLKVVNQFAVATDEIVDLEFSTDGAQLHAATGKGVLTSLSLADGAARFRVEHGAATSGLAQSADGKLLATAGSDGKLRLWNSADAAPVAAIEVFGSPIQHATITADGRFVVASAGSTVVLCDIATARPAQRLVHQPDGDVALLAAGTSSDSLLSIAADGAVRIWPIAAQRQLVGHRGAVTAIDTLHGTKHLVSGGEDGTLREWDLDTAAEVRQFELGAPVTALATRPDGQRIAAAGADNTVRLWETAEAKQVAQIKGDFKVHQAVAALTSKQAVAKQNAEAAQQALAAAEKDRTEKQEAIPQAQEHLNAQIAALTEADAKSATANEAQVQADQLAAETAERAKTAMDAKAASEKLAADLADVVALANDALAKAQAAVEAETAAQTATSALVAATKSAAEKLQSDAMLTEMTVAIETVIKDRAAADEQLKSVLASLSGFATEKQAAAAAASEKKTADEAALAEAEAASKQAADAKVAATKAAEEAAAAAKTALSNKQSAEKQLAEAQRVAKLAEELIPMREAARTEAADIVAKFEQALAAENERAPQHERPIRSLAFSPDNRLLATAGEDQVVRTYMADDGAPFESLAGHSGTITALEFDTDTKLFSASADHTARLWDLYAEWTYAGQLGLAGDNTTALADSAFADRVLALAFSPDSKLLATAGGEPSRNGELKIWNVAERSVVLDLPEAHSDTIFGLEFSPDGKYLATCGADKFVRVFEVSTGKQIRSFEGHTHHVLDVTWRADGKVLASCGADNAVKTWDFESGEQQRSIAGFGKEVTSVAFVGTGGEVLTSAGDKTLRLHNTADGRNQRNFGGGTDFMYIAQTTADGQWVIGAGADSVLRVWNAADGKQVRKFDPPKPENQPSAK